jgi:hypothetical protein
MRAATPLQKIAQYFIVVIFFAGSCLVVWRVHDRAYDDLPTFYWATQLAFKDHVSAYQPQYFQALGQSLDRKIYPFLYPPPSLVIFSPFLLGNYEHIKTAFTLCNLVLWWLLTWLMYRLYCRCSPYKQHFFASLLIPLWSLSFMPVADTFRTGQVNLFVLVCVTPLFFQSSRYQWQVFSGVLLAIAITLKVYLLLALPVLIVMRQKKIWLTAFVVLGLLCLASLFLQPVHMWSDWLLLSRSSGGYGKQLPYVMTIPWNQSINGFFIRQFLDQRILSGSSYWHWPIYVCSGVLLVTTFFAICKGLAGRINGISHAIALILLVIVIVAPLTWLHHYVFAMPAVICCFAMASNLEKSKYKKMMMVIMVAALVMGFPPLMGLVFPTLAGWKMINGIIPFTANLVVSAQLLAGLSLLGLFTLLILRTGK